MRQRVRVHALAQHLRAEPSFLCQTGFDAFPAADIVNAQENQRDETKHDQEELDDLVIDSGGQTAQERVNQYDKSRDQYTGIEVPAQEQVQQFAHCVHGDTGGEHRHHREGNGIETASFFVKTQLQVFRNGTRA